MTLTIHVVVVGENNGHGLGQRHVRVRRAPGGVGVGGFGAFRCMNRPNESTDPSIDCGSDTLAVTRLVRRASIGGRDERSLCAMDRDRKHARSLAHLMQVQRQMPAAAAAAAIRTSSSYSPVCCCLLYVFCVIRRGRPGAWMGKSKPAACRPPPSLHQSLRGPRPTHGRAPAAGSHSHAHTRGQ